MLVELMLGELIVTAPPRLSLPLANRTQCKFDTFHLKVQSFEYEDCKLI